MTHYEKQSSKELRAGMGEGLVEAGRKNENVVAPERRRERQRQDGRLRSATKY